MEGGTECMSSTDNRIVQMQFDNAQFEKGVKQTMDSLDKLESSLQLNGASKGMQRVSEESKTLCNSMSKVDEAVQVVKIQFSYLEVAGITAMVRLTNAAINVGKKINNAIFGQIISGGKIRSQNIENKDLNEVNRNINKTLESIYYYNSYITTFEISEDINYGVKDTAYGLDEAAKVASQLVASNVQIGDDMKDTLRAISGVAAMTNSTYSEIGNIFTTVASNGKLMTMQLRQLSSRGLNVSAALAKEMNKSEEEINDMVSKGKISFAEFASAMDNAFGEHAKEANKTFSGALSNMKAALSRIGQKFADPVYENVRKILNNFTPIIDSINTALTPVYDMFNSIAETLSHNINLLLQNEDIIEGIQWLALDLYSYIRPIIGAIKELGIVGNDWSGPAKSFKEWAQSIQLYGDNAIRVKDILVSLFRVAGLGFEAVKAVLVAISPIFKAISGTLYSIFGVSGSLADQINGAYPTLVNIIRAMGEFGKIKMEALLIRIGNAIKKIDWDALVRALKVVTAIVLVLFNVMLQFVPYVVNFISYLFTNLPKVIRMLGGLILGLVSGIASIGNFFGSLFSGGTTATVEIDTKNMSTSGLQEVSKSMDEITEKAPRVTKSLENVSDSVEDVSKKSSRAVKGVSKDAQDASKDVEVLSDDLDKIKDKQKADEAERERRTSHNFQFRSEGRTQFSEKDSDFGMPDPNNAFGRFDARGDGLPAIRGINKFFNAIINAFNIENDNFIKNVLLTGEKINNGFETVFSIVKTGVEWLVNGLWTLIKPVEGIGDVMRKIFTVDVLVAIAVVGLMFKAINTVINFIGALPKAAQGLADWGKSKLHEQMWKTVLSIAALTAAVSAAIIALTYMSNVLDVSKLKDLFDAIQEGCKTLFRIVTVFTGLYMVGYLLIALSKFLNAIAIFKFPESFKKNGSSIMLELSSASDLLIGIVAAMAGIIAIAVMIKELDMSDALNDAIGMMRTMLSYIGLFIGFVLVFYAAAYKLMGVIQAQSHSVFDIKQMNLTTDKMSDPMVGITVMILTMIPLVLSMTYACLALSSIPTDKLFDSMIALTMFFGILTIFMVGLMASVERFEKDVSIPYKKHDIGKQSGLDKKQLDGIIKIVLSLTAMVAVISASMAGLAYVQSLGGSVETAMISVCTTIVAIMVGWSFICDAVKKKDTDQDVVNNTVKIMAAMSALLLAVGGSLAIMTVAGVTWDAVVQMITILVVIGVFVLIVSGVLEGINKNAKDGQLFDAKAITSLMLSLSVLLISVAGAMALMTLANWDQMWQLIIILGSILIFVSVLYGVTSAISSKWGSGDLSEIPKIMYSLSAVLLAIALTMFILEKIDWSAMEGSIPYLIMMLVFVGVIGGITIALSAINNMGSTIASFAGFILLLFSIAAVCKILETIDWYSLEYSFKYLIMFTVLLAIVGGITIALSAMPAGLVGAAVVMGLLIGTLLAISLALFMIGFCCKQIADGVETVVDALTRIGEIDVGACEDVVEFLGDFLGSLATLTANAAGAMSGIALLSLFMIALSVAMGIIGSMDQTQIDAGIEAIHKIFKMIETTFIQNSDMYEKLPAIAGAISSAIIMLGIALVVGMASVLIGATLLVLAGSILLLGSGLIQSGLQAFIDVMNEIGPQLPELGQQMVDLVLIGIQILLGGTILTIGSVLLLVGAAILLGAAAVLNSAMGVLQEALEQGRLDYITGNMGGIMILGLQMVLAGALLLAGGLVFLIGSTIFAAAAEMFKSGAQAFETGVDSFCDGIDRIVETVETVRQAAEDFMSAGQNIMFGLNNGIADESDSVLDTVGEVGADIIEGFCDLMGIHSPSDVFYEIGKFICEGLNIGVEENSFYNYNILFFLKF